MKASITVAIPDLSYTGEAELDVPAPAPIPVPLPPIVRDSAVLHTSDHGIGATDSTDALNRFFRETVKPGSKVIVEGIVSASGTVTLGGLQGVEVVGENRDAAIHQTGAYDAPFLVIRRDSVGVTVRKLDITSEATKRSGGHLVIVNGRDHLIEDVDLHDSPEFALFAGSSKDDISENIRLRRVTAYSPFGDGLHFGAVRGGLMEDCHAWNPGDDGIAVAADFTAGAEYYSADILLSGVSVTNGLRRGIVIEDAKRVVVEDFLVDAVDQAALWCTVWQHVHRYNEQITFRHGVVKNSNRLAGAGRAALMAAYTRGLSIHDVSLSLAKGSGMNGMFFADVHRLTGTGVRVFGSEQHGVAVYDGDTGADDFGLQGRTLSRIWNDLEFTRCDMVGNTNQHGLGFSFIPHGNTRLVNLRAISNSVQGYKNPIGIGYGHTVNGVISNHQGGALVEAAPNENTVVY